MVNAASSCAPVTNASVEIWQCDHQGVYSEYGEGRGQTFLRGIQLTDAQGQVTFETVYPGWYQGRATHIHVEVTIGWPIGEGHADRVSGGRHRPGLSNRCLRRQGAEHTTNARDNVFADSVSQEMITLSGNTTSGFTGTFTVGVSV